MRPKRSIQRWFAASACLIAITASVSAEEGIVRMSDADSQPGVVRIGQKSTPEPQVTQTKKKPANYAAVYIASPQMNAWQPVSYNNYGMAYPQGAYSPAAYSTAESYSSDGCQNGYCGDMQMYGSGACCDQEMNCCESMCFPTDYCDSGNCQYGNAYGGNCQSAGDCFYGPGYKDRSLTLLARATPKGSCGGGRYPKRWWRGQQLNYLSRNQRLSNTLFGWLVPSGCCGQGCPPVGKYQITYADQPEYSHPQDGMAYGAQGYGVPVTVALPPNVHQSYNYSHGLPASRITQIGHYTPGSTPQPLYRQSW